MEYKREFSDLYQDSVSCASKSFFFRTWKRHCPKIKNRKLGRFTKCTVCVELREEMESAIKEGRPTKLIKELHRGHVRFVQRERLEYKKKRDKAKLQPDKYLSVIIDMADQSGFCLLYTSPSPRDQRGSRMPSSA